MAARRGRGSGWAHVHIVAVPEDGRSPRGRRMVDEVVRAEDELITIRKPEDLPKFCETIVKVFAQRLDDARMNSANEQCSSG